jgi:LDH2 family malate/lactate/ureidoglycolate dehydrogenase
MYVDDVDNKTTDANAKPVVLKESPATAWVDGSNGLGPVVGNFCMQLAIEKAKSVGVGWVVAKRKSVDHTEQARMMYVQCTVKFEILTTMVSKFQIFWDVPRDHSDFVFSN